MWEAINGAWIELGRFETSNNGFSRYDREELSRFFEFVKKTSLDYDGSVDRTMLRNMPIGSRGPAFISSGRITPPASST